MGCVSRRVALVVVSVLGALLAGGARAEEPSGLDAAQRELEEVVLRLEELVALANRDPRFRLIEIYKGYRIEDFRDSRRRVEAKDLVAILADPAAQFQVRKAAYDLLVSERAKNYDPDLSSEQRGPRSPRKQFALRYVLPLVKEDDGVTATFAHELLVDHHGRPLHPDIRNYNPRESTRQQRRKAYDAWRDFLRR
jgi:hypothetical protein